MLFASTRQDFAVVAALLASCLVAERAGATAFEVSGLGPVGVAEVGARAARADDGSAAFHNPGGLALGSGAHVELSALFAASRLVVQGHTAALSDPFGLALTFDATVPFEGALRDRVRIGFAGYFPTGSAMRLITRAGDEPFFPYYDNRTQRIVVLPALGVRLAEGVGIGLGVNVLAGVSGPADVRPGASGAPEARIDETATAVLRANIGARFDPSESFRFALVFRQGFSAASMLTTTAEIGGVPLAVDVTIAEALCDPDVLIAASSFDLGRFSFELDASYARWSAYRGPFVEVHASFPGVDISSKLPEGLFRDVVRLRGAASRSFELSEAADLVVRGGAGVEPSILDGARQGRSNLVDGDKVFLGLGATVSVREWLPKTLRVGAGVGAQVVMPFEQEKVVCSAAPCPLDTVAGQDAEDPSMGVKNPGFPALSASGVFWSMALGVGVDL